MQLDLPFLRTPIHERFDPPIRPEPAIDFVRVRRARRYILRVRPDGCVRVTVPRGGSRAEAMRFVEQQSDWIERERARVRSIHGVPRWTHGSMILLRGQPVRIEVCDDGERIAQYGDRSVKVPDDAADLRACIESDLRALAREELGPRLRELAAALQLTPAGVTIRNQQSRWGSCSRNGRIALNFRLVQMPAQVSDYVLVHELMHLKQQNHSRSFWRLVQRACPEFRAAERWLKTDGRQLF